MPRILTALLLALAAVVPGVAAAAPTATLVPVTTANLPVDIVNAGDGRLFIVEQRGLIRILPEGGGALTTFLDLSALVSQVGNERGLFSLAFDPDYAQNGLFYVSYTDTNGDSVVARYSVSGDPDVADPNSATVLFGPLTQPAGNHNGGRLQFDAGGALYYGLGDGGGSADPSCFAQNDATLLGKLLRLDVSTVPAGVQVVAKGLRNPWRFAFDPITGDLFIGDVGQNTQEEIDYHPSGTPDGRNYGWKVMEGTFCFDPDPIDPDCPAGTPSCFDAAYTPPIATYAHGSGGVCSVTGGYVYRGSKEIPYGVYFYGDYCSGQVWSLERTAPNTWTSTPLLDGGSFLRTFGEDADRELYAAFGNDIVRFAFDGPDRPMAPGLPGAWLVPLGIALLGVIALARRRL